MILQDGRSIPGSVEMIIRQVSAAHGVSPQEIFGRRRFKTIYQARHEAIWRVRREVRVNGQPPSMPLIGRWFGRDHSSVLNALRQHDARETRSDLRIIRFPPAEHRYQLAFDIAEACG